MRSVKITFSFVHSFLNTIGIVLCLASPVLAGGGHQHGPNGEHLGGAGTDGQAIGPVTLSDEAIANLGIETISVEETLSAPTRALFGKVIAHPRKVTAVGGKFNGRVEQLFVMEGDSVRKGEKLVKVRPIQAGANSVILVAPEAGSITNVRVSRGEAFQSGEELIEVSDLSELLFRGELFDSSATAHVRTGVPCSIVMTALPDRTIRCKVELIDSVFRGTPPVLYIYSSVSNKDLLLKPNMSGKLHLDVGESVLRKLVPKGAVLGDFSNRFVFTRRGNVFSREKVVIGIEKGEEIEVKAGLKLGDDVVTQGHYQLQFAKSSAESTEGAAHAHDHSDHDHEDGEGGHAHEH